MIQRFDDLISLTHLFSCLLNERLIALACAGKNAFLWDISASVMLVTTFFQLASRNEKGLKERLNWICDKIWEFYFLL